MKDALRYIRANTASILERYLALRQILLFHYMHDTYSLLVKWPTLF